MRRMAGLLLALALCQLIAWAIPADPQSSGIPYYLPLHVLMETASIVVAMLVFSVGWNSYTGESSGNLLLLACMFFVVGLLDFSHTASYGGMPDFLSHNDSEKHLNFWLAARLLAASALLLVSVRPWQRQLNRVSKYVIFSGLLVGLFAINAVVIYHQDWLPHLFIPGQGLTALKKGLEYLVIAINLLTAALLWAKMRGPLPFNAALLFGAVGVMAMSEFFFTLYTTMTGAYNVLGHIYKVISYVLIYRAVVVEAVERPYLQLTAARKNLALAVEASTTGMVMVDAHGSITLTNAQANAMFGYAPGALIGKPLQTLIPEAQRDVHEQRMQRYLLDPTEKSMGGEREVWGRHQQGHNFRVEIGLTPIASEDGRFVIASVQDITRQVEHERRINQLIHFDPLTGLPNRTLLHDRVNQAIQAATRHQSHVAILFLDLDHFKNVNDTLGHNTGDDLLVEVGKRLTGAIRESDTVARVGGDEFVIVLAETDAAEAATVAAKLLSAVSERYLIGNHSLATTPSIGIAIYPQDGADFGMLYQHADTAMYRTKQDGRNGYQFFTAAMQSHTERMLTLESCPQQALEFGQFYLDYQPQLSIDGQRVLGVEALLRWRHPELGLISPSEFVPLAESNGQIIPIGTWVMRTAVQQLRDWLDAGLPPMVMAVNLSAVQFRHPNLPALVTEILNEAQVPPEYLEVELTEGVTMGNPKAAIGIMDDLHSRGVRMSIDDFGTGYSSLSYLKKFKVYKLKIDQSFVRDIATDADDRATGRLLPPSSKWPTASASSPLPKGWKRRPSWSSCARKPATKCRVICSADRWHPRPWWTLCCRPGSGPDKAQNRRLDSALRLCLDPVAAIFLGHVERTVGTRHQVQHRILLPAGGNTHRDGDADAARLHVHRRKLHTLAQAVRRRQRALQPQRWQHHNEFIATKAANHIGFTQLFFQRMRDQANHLITCGMAERVVDRLEAVNIEHQQGQRSDLAPAARQFQFQVFRNATPVHDPGQFIGQRQLLDFLAQGAFRHQHRVQILGQLQHPLVARNGVAHAAVDTQGLATQHQQIQRNTDDKHAFRLHVVKPQQRHDDQHTNRQAISQKYAQIDCRRGHHKSQRTGQNHQPDIKRLVHLAGVKNEYRNAPAKANQGTHTSFKQHGVVDCFARIKAAQGPRSVQKSGCEQQHQTQRPTERALQRQRPHQVRQRHDDDADKTHRCRKAGSSEQLLCQRGIQFLGGGCDSNRHAGLPCEFLYV